MKGSAILESTRQFLISFLRTHPRSVSLTAVRAPRVLTVSCMDLSSALSCCVQSEELLQPALVLLLIN